MKKTYIFCTNPIRYITEIPLIFLLILSIYFNSGASGLLKLYPLIIATIAIMIFIFIFFFRMIIISAEEVKIVGKFTSQSRADVIKGRTLVFTHFGKRRLRVELFDDGKKAPELEFLKNDPTYKPQGINLFREKATVTDRAVERALRNLEINEKDISKIFSCDTYTCKYPTFNVTSEITEEALKVSIEFTKTV